MCWLTSTGGPRWFLPCIDYSPLKDNIKFTPKSYQYGRYPVLLRHCAGSAVNFQICWALLFVYLKLLDTVRVLWSWLMRAAKRRAAVALRSLKEVLRMVGMAVHKTIPSPPSFVCLVSSSPKRLSQVKFVTTSIRLNKMLKKLEGSLTTGGVCGGGRSMVLLRVVCLWLAVCSVGRYSGLSCVVCG